MYESVFLFPTMRLLIITSLLCAATLGGTLVNPSFESPDLAKGSSAGLSGWSVSSSATSAGVWHIPAPQINVTAPDGNQIAYLSGAGATEVSFAQQTGYALGAGLQGFSAVGLRRGDGQSGSFMLEMWVGGNVVDGNIVGGVLLDSELFNVLSVDLSGFAPVTVSYDAAMGHSAIGEMLSVRVVRTGGGQVNVDNFAYSASLIEAVPEASTLGLMAAGMLAMVVLARRR